MMARRIERPPPESKAPAVGAAGAEQGQKNPGRDQVTQYHMTRAGATWTVGPDLLVLAFAAIDGVKP